MNKRIITFVYCLLLMLIVSNQAVAAWVEGNLAGKVSLVLLFDYACPHCQATCTQLEKAIQNESQLRIILRPVAILNQSSDLLARAALAAEKQGKAQLLHQKILQHPSCFSVNEIINLAKEASLNINQFKRDIHSNTVTNELKQNYQALQSTQGTGVPSILMGLSNATQYAIAYQGEISPYELRQAIYQLEGQA